MVNRGVEKRLAKLESAWGVGKAGGEDSQRAEWERACRHMTDEQKREQIAEDLVVLRAYAKERRERGREVPEEWRRLVDGDDW